MWHVLKNGYQCCIVAPLLSGLCVFAWMTAVLPLVLHSPLREQDLCEIKCLCVMGRQVAPSGAKQPWWQLNLMVGKSRQNQVWGRWSCITSCENQGHPPEAFRKPLLSRTTCQTLSEGPKTVINIKTNFTPSKGRCKHFGFLGNCRCS